jgi:hypothetical protein
MMMSRSICRFNIFESILTFKISMLLDGKLQAVMLCNDVGREREEVIVG